MNTLFKSTCVIAVIAGILYVHTVENIRIEKRNSIIPILEYHVLFQQDVEVIAQYTDDEKRILCEQLNECKKLAEAVVFEARSESRQGMRAVASVIMNRVDSPRFPNTVQAVIMQDRQFSYLQDMHKQKTPTDDDWQLAYVVAYNIKHGEVNRTTEADHYLNPSKVKRLPMWAKVYKQTDIIGSHHFYTSER